MSALDPGEFEVTRDGWALAGDEVGEGPPIITLHGLTATRRYVVHGSRALARAGFRLVSYDARGHGTSDPPPAGEGYSYPALARDLAAVIDSQVGSSPVVLAGHSMGAHTVAAYALERPERIAGLVVIGPTSIGLPPAAEALDDWERLAAGLERDGIEGFLSAYEPGIDPRWRDVVVRITRTRLALHARLDAVAQALREVPRSLPFDDIAELSHLDVPALVVASNDDADPGHPYSVAEAWASRLPRARLVSEEEEGQSPLAWQGGRLSKEIASFCQSGEVAEALLA